MSLNMLFVDDDKDVRAMFESKIKDHIEGFKYDLKLAESGKEALELIRKENFDIVIVDLKIPDVSGLTILQEISSNFPKIKVIMISVTKDLKIIREAMNYGAFDFLAKPLNFYDLGASILKAYEAIISMRVMEGELKESYDRLQRTLRQIIESMAKITEIKDPYTAGHQRRVARLSKAIAEELGLPEFQIEGIYTAGLLHDIGKIVVPAEILSRPGELTANEISVIRDHAAAGHQILKNVEFPWPIADIIGMHHERLDGSGYPRGIKEDEILFEAKIIAVADVVEAVTSFRPYRPGLGIEKAISVIKNLEGKHFDPKIVKACITLLQDKNFKIDENGD